MLLDILLLLPSRKSWHVTAIMNVDMVTETMTVASITVRGTGLATFDLLNRSTSGGPLVCLVVMRNRTPMLPFSMTILMRTWASDCLASRQMFVVMSIFVMIVRARPLATVFGFRVCLWVLLRLIWVVVLGRVVWWFGC